MNIKIRKTLLITGSSGVIGTRLSEILFGSDNIICVDKKKNKWHKHIDDITLNILRKIILN